MTNQSETTGGQRITGHGPQAERTDMVRTTFDQDNEDAHRLTEDVAKLRDELDRRNAELDLLRTELEFVRVLSRRQRAAGGYSAALAHERQSIAQSASAFIERMLLATSQKWLGVSREAQFEAIRRSGLFDSDWYLKRYPDVAKSGMDPLRHYFKFGAWEGRDPHPLLDTDWYQMTYPDAATREMTALGHFVCIGAKRGYDPNPLFHTDWYVAQNPDAATAQVNPLRHYIDHATEEGRNPNPLFDSAWYLKENPDVAAEGENPLSHYIHSGVGELRDPHPLFDTEWYLDRYQHVVANGMDALEHYLTIGAFEGCRPGPGMRARQRRPQIDRHPRLGGEVGRLADWLGADFGSTSDGNMVSALSPSPVDVLGWQMRLGRRPPRVPGFEGQIGVFVHLFYEDLADEIASHLLAIPFPLKVYVSTNSSEKKEKIETAFRQWGFDPVIKVLPNRGWDVAAFLLGFAEEVHNHEICLKLHGKQSRHNSREQGAKWRRHLLSGLLGSPQNVSFILSSFVACPDLGVLMTRHWKGIAQGVNAIGVNYLPMRALLGRVGLSISPDQPIEFPSGSMFWFRSAALAPLFELGLTWADFNGCRARSRDATIAHGIERCILIFAAKARFKWAFLPPRWASRWRLQRAWGFHRTAADRRR